MEPSSSLYSIKKVRCQTLEKNSKEETQVVRWRGRNIIIRKGASFSWWGKENDDSFLETTQKSPKEILLKMLNQSKKEEPKG